MMKLFSIKETSIPWILASECELVYNPDEADYIIYETAGDPVHEVANIKNLYPRDKLVFILSGDLDVSDDESLWFASNLVPSENKFQLYITNPRIYATEPSFEEKDIFGYFGGTIWEAPEREFMYSLSEKWVIEPVDNYWHLPNEDRVIISNKSYEKIKRSLYTLCPRGNGPSSMRIIEALACGSIPILINDDTDPFDENFGDMVIQLPLSDIPDIEKIIDNLPVPTTDDFNTCIEFYKNNVCVNNKIPWSVGSGFAYKIIDILKEKKGL